MNVVITKRGAERWRRGHPWIFKSDVVRPPTSGTGEIVAVTEDNGRAAGFAFYSAQSMIALRFLAKPGVTVDRAFFKTRLERAIALRETLLAPGSQTARLVFAESDGLPGVIVDRYGTALSIQTLIAGADQRKPMLIELLDELLHPSCIVERNDVRVRSLEGLPEIAQVVMGKIPAPLLVEEHGITLEVDLIGGQKTGAFLDQRANREVALRVAKGRALDIFAYQGWFAMHLAKKATSVVAVDVSEPALEMVKRNAAHNGFANVGVQGGNAFDLLHDLERTGARFDTIVLDPPAFAKSRAALEGGAIRGYKEVNLRAMKLLAPGGHLITASCSYHLSETAFHEMLVDAAGDVGRPIQLVQRLGQAPDHPALL